MNRSVSIFLLIFLQYSIANSQSQAHRIIKERMELKNIPGIAFLIARDGEILDEGYFGKANLELDVDVSGNSVFAIASMSKTYTAAAILLLVERGKLRLDDSVRKYIPESPDSWEAITIMHLLTHSSGLIEDWELNDWNKSHALFLKTQTQEELLKLHFNQELKFKPGTDTRYASGHFILGVVIERVTGQSYSMFLKNHIFSHLSLEKTYVDHPYEIITDRVSGYVDYDSAIINSSVSGIGNGNLIAPINYGRGDAGIRTTTHDLLKFYNALLSSELLNEQSRKMMFEPATLDNGNYVSTAAGWMNWPIGGLAISEHSGVFRTGFSSQALLIPGEKFVIIILTNLRSGSSFSLAKELASLYYPELKQLSERISVKDPRADLTDIHLVFFQKISSGQINETVHGEFPFSYYSKDLIASISGTESITYLGENKVENEEVNFFDVDIRTLRYYRLNGKHTFYTTVYLDEEDKLVFIDYPETK